METEVWKRARAEADVTLMLPGGVEMFFRKIPAAGRSFVMGSRNGEPNEEPRHRVTFPENYDYWLGTFVVTQAQWRAVAVSSDEPELRKRAEPSHFRENGERRPVEKVSWDDAVAWCAALMETKAFRDAVEAGIIPKDVVACLPSETEWEFACKCGSSEDLEYYNGDGEAALAEVGWYSSNSGDGTHDVDELVGASPEGHSFRLFGMHGNVWEWCSDFGDWDDMGEYRQRIDGDGPIAGADGQHRVLRGGSWFFSPRGCRSASRLRILPGLRGGGQGFRVCLAPGPAKPPAQKTDRAEAKPSADDGGGVKPTESGALGAAGASGGVVGVDWDGARLPRLAGDAEA